MEYPISEFSSDALPVLLKEIPDPPNRLFCRGTFPPEDLIPVAVVGSRKASGYGRDAVRTIVEGLRGYPIAIISGLALGIDAAAHKAALSAGLYTCAVPGSGLADEVLYPRAHAPLAREILHSGGGLISEFPPSQKAAPWTFPRRNRIMAGLSQASLIIEAEERSGTLITARLALEYNREVWATPGSIFSRTAVGANSLIAAGATPITRARDVLVQLGLAEEKWVEERKRTQCTTEEKYVLALLSQPLPKKELLSRIPLEDGTARIILSAMELKGLIVQRLGKMHRR